MIATTGPDRSELLPGVPSVRELGMLSLAFSAWFGLVAPAATPEPVRAELEAAVRRALAAAPVRARMREAGFRAATGGGDRAAFAALIRDETARWAEVVRSTGFKAIE